MQTEHKENILDLVFQERRLEYSHPILVLYNPLDRMKKRPQEQSCFEGVWSSERQES